VADDRPLVFISYVHAEALDFAGEARIAFAECGFRTWVWHYDHGPEGSAKLDMVKNIEESDYFLDISTVGSRDSDGQNFERVEASKRNKPPIILAFSREYISEEWKGEDPRIYNDVQRDTFAPMCRKIAQQLLNRRAEDEPEGESIEHA
jgi:hypothetical protein